MYHMYNLAEEHTGGEGLLVGTRVDTVSQGRLRIQTAQH
jgi:hypothetical protein